MPQSIRNSKSRPNLPSIEINNFFGKNFIHNIESEELLTHITEPDFYLYENEQKIKKPNALLTKPNQPIFKELG